MEIGAILVGLHNFKGLLKGRKHGFKIEVRTEFRLGLVGMVRVRSWVMYYVRERVRERESKQQRFLTEPGTNRYLS